MLTLVACIGIPSTVRITLAVRRYTIKPKPFKLFQMVHAMGRARLNGSLPIHFTIKLFRLQALLQGEMRPTPDNFSFQTSC